MLNRRRLASRLQRGLSIVELMIGITVGLFIVGAASLVVTAQLSENRRLLLETQLQQDLRAAADIITRELRRTGYWSTSNDSLWFPGRTSAPARNTFAGLTQSEESSAITFKYQRGAGVDGEGPYGFRVTSSGVIQTQLASAGWQDLTDAAVMNVTDFDLEVETTESEPLPCPQMCPSGTTDCWPKMETQTVSLVITAASRADETVTRTLATRVRLRNDQMQFNNGSAVCP